MRTSGDVGAAATGLLLVMAGLSAATKTWRRNTDWATPGNWALGRVPCGGDRVVLPAALTAAVRLPEGVSAVRELRLPLSGELLLPVSGALLLHTGPAPGCPGQDMEFSRLEPAAWLDERSWTTDVAASEAAAWAAGAVPHLERVPCAWERAVFPAGSSFMVRLPEVPVAVGSIQLDGQELDAGAWRAALESEPGRRQFRSPEAWLAGAVTPLGAGCPYAGGCPCQRPSVLPAVCRHVGPCRDVFCHAPVTPRGHCCPVCGAYLLLEYSAADFSLEQLRGALRRLLPPGVAAHASTPDVELVAQVVLADVEASSGVSADAAPQLAAALLQEPSLGVLGADTFAAGPELRGGAVLALLSFTVGALAVVLLTLAALFFVFVYRQGGSLHGDGRPFVFARFDNAEQEEGSVAVLAPTPPPQKAFHNPMYGQPAAAQQEEQKVAPPSFTELQSRAEAQELVEVDIAAATAAAASSDV